MEKHVFQILERGRRGTSRQSARPVILIPFNLELYGKQVAFEAVCTESQMTLKDIVYPAHQLSDNIVCRTIEYQDSIGNPVSCSAGCIGCCKYAITVSLAEAFAINNIIQNLHRRSRLNILKKMAAAGEKILRTYTSLTRASQSQDTQLSSQLIEFSRWYSSIDLTCPWLEKQLCSEYPGRPLVCREFLVTSSPNRCNSNAQYGRSIVDLPVKMAEVLMSVCAKLTHSSPMAILFPLIPAECEEYRDLQDKQFEAHQIVELIVESIYEQYRQGSVMSEKYSYAMTVLE